MNATTTKAYPLQWPDGWPRTRANARRKSHYKVTEAKSAQDLRAALRRMRASNAIVSTNLPLRRDGSHAFGGDLDDPGVAVYWDEFVVGVGKQQRVIACDMWLTVGENERAIFYALEALRTIKRSGASQILDRVFQAFGALPAAAVARPARQWWEVFGLEEAVIKMVSFSMVKAKYQELALQAHPDRNNGVDLGLVELNAALEQAKAYYQV